MGKRILVVLMIVSMIVMGLTACSGDEGTSEKDQVSSGDTAQASEGNEVKDVTLKIWSPEEEQEVTTALCDAFAAEHPEYNITFEYAIMGNDAVCDELKKDLSVAADVFTYPSAAIPELTQAGILYPLTLGVDEITAINGEGAISAVSKEGNLFGVPQTPNSWFMYYNKSLFNESDIQNLDQMLAKDLGDDVTNFSLRISDSWYMSAFFYAVDGTLYGPEGLDPEECSWNDANGMKVGQYLIDLANNPNYLENLDGVGDSLFKEGKLGAICSGTWSAADYIEALGDDLGAYKLPTITVDGSDYQLSNFADFRAWGVKSSTQFPVVAQELASFLGSEPSQLAIYEATGIAPTVQSLASNEIVAADVAVTALLSQSNYSTPQPAIPQLSEYWTPAIAFGTGIINGDITESNLQDSLDAMVTSITTPAIQ